MLLDELARGARVIKTFQFRGKPYRVYCVEKVPDHASWFSFKDEEEVRERHWTIGEGDVVLDVGACFGSYTLTALAAGAAQVFAWSPGVKVEGEDLESNMLRVSSGLNGWLDRCHVFDTGVYDRSGWLDIETLTFDPANRAIGSYVIYVQPLDRWFHSARSIIKGAPRYWLKIDVEGAEEQVIRGGLDTISVLRPNILLENHYFRRASIEEEVRRLVLSLGYREVATTPYQTVSHSLYVPAEVPA